MNRRALMPCRGAPDCPVLIEGGGYCDDHKPAPWQHPNRRPLPANWDVLHEAVLRRDGYACRWLVDTDGWHVRCGQPAKKVDHITPRAEGGSDSMENLQSLCDAHAAVKDALDAARGRRRALA